MALRAYRIFYTVSCIFPDMHAVMATDFHNNINVQIDIKLTHVCVSELTKNSRGYF
jgi:hypothetical protein